MRKHNQTYISLTTAAFYAFLAIIAVALFTRMAYIDHCDRQDSELTLSGVYGVQEAQENE